MTSLAKKIGLIGVGVAAGGVLAGTLSAGAASSTPNTSNLAGADSTALAPDSGAVTSGGTAVAPDGTALDPAALPPAGTPGMAHGRGGHPLGLTGTVAVVGKTTLGIKDSAGKITTYQVISSSDIDKNGEAVLANLKVGDAVHFSAVNGAIDKLHAGDEAKNRPSGMPGGPGGPGGPGDTDAPGKTTPGTAPGTAPGAATTGGAPAADFTAPNA